MLSVMNSSCASSLGTAAFGKSCRSRRNAGWLEQTDCGRPDLAGEWLRVPLPDFRWRCGRETGVPQELPDGNEHADSQQVAPALVGIVVRHHRHSADLYRASYSAKRCAHPFFCRIAISTIPFQRLVSAKVTTALWTARTIASPSSRSNTNPLSPSRTVSANPPVRLTTGSTP